MRNDGRSCNQIRPIKITFDVFGYADCSVLFEQGGTKVLVGVTLQDGVPRFLKGQGTGWLTAEYSLLPTSTKDRSQRATSAARPNGRSLEISRIIGRSLRAVIDTSLIGERTVTVDCDVLQADGGTRCACISAASFALKAASMKWCAEGITRREFLSSPLAAISVGMVDASAYLDLSQEEDNRAEVDFNFVLSKSGDIVEIQGTSEKHPISWENFDVLKNFSLEGAAQIFSLYDSTTFPEYERVERGRPPKRESAFSLGRRLDLKNKNV